MTTVPCPVMPGMVHCSMNVTDHFKWSTQTWMMNVFRWVRADKSQWRQMKTFCFRSSKFSIDRCSARGQWDKSGQQTRANRFEMRGSGLQRSVELSKDLKDWSHVTFPGNWISKYRRFCHGVGDGGPSQRKVLSFLISLRCEILQLWWYTIESLYTQS